MLKNQIQTPQYPGSVVRQTENKSLALIILLLYLLCGSTLPR